MRRRLRPSAGENDADEAFGMSHLSAIRIQGIFMKNISDWNPLTCAIHLQTNVRAAARRPYEARRPRCAGKEGRRAACRPHVVHKSSGVQIGSNRKGSGRRAVSRRRHDGIPVVSRFLRAVDGPGRHRMGRVDALLCCFSVSTLHGGSYVVCAHNPVRIHQQDECSADAGRPRGRQCRK